MDQYTYLLGYDSDPTQGTNFTTFDLIITTFADHAIGDNSTVNGGGVTAADSAAYLGLIASKNVAQNSWKAHWFLSPFDPTIDGTYDFYLAAFDGSGTELARTEMQIIAGAGGASVPEPAALVLISAGLFGFGFARKRA